MPIELQSNPIDLSPPIRSVLGDLRRRIRSYIWLQGLALVVAWVMLSFWITLALDWMIEPPPLFRALLLVVVGGVLLWILYRFILARAFVPLNDTSMAVLLERRYGNFRDSLLTTVELASHPDHAASFNREMLSYTRGEALEHAARVRVSDIFENRPLMRSLFAAVVLAASVGVFALVARDAFAVWFNRSLLLSQELWPRKTRLSIEGFDDDRQVKVARGSSFRVVALADQMYQVPETIQIRYRTEEGNPGRENMVVEPARPADAQQPFSYEFPSLLSSVTFDIVGGDDRLRDYRIEVVDNPTVSEMTLHCEYPAYMGRSPRELRVTGLMQIPLGTRVTIRAKANKPLEQVRIERVADQGFELIQTIDRFADDEQRQFSVSLPPLADDLRLQFRLQDTDKIVGREPVRLDLTAVPDDPPRVGLQLAGIGSHITTRARLPVVGEVVDDYGIEKIWFEYQVDRQPAAQLSLLTQPDGRDTIKYDREPGEALDLKELADTPALRGEAGAESDDNGKSTGEDQRAGDAANDEKTNNEPEGSGALVLKEGQRLTIAVKALDRSTLEGGPFIGSSERYQLDVVSPDQLLAILEARELLLRQRFETIIEEFENTRDLLARVEFEGRPQPMAKRTPDDARPRGENLKGAEPEDALKSADKQKTAEEEDPTSPAEAVEQTRASRLLAVERGLENSERTAHETRAVGMAFIEILDEMANNRIDTPALAGRLRDEIAHPLVFIADGRMPVVIRQLKELQKLMDDAQRAPAKLNEAISDADSILLEMRAVLDKMIEMATYKELVERLRKVIEAQEGVNRRTKQQQVEKLKGLIEE